MPTNTVHVIIDNRPIEALRTASVLEAARKAGIEIPTLCWREGIEPYGACRLCLVEFQRKGWTPDYTRITASCTLPVEDGLRVETQSPRVRELRGTVMQLLLARAPQSPELQAMAERLGVAPDSRLVPADEKCILCGMCVRVCAEVAGAEAISFRHRGTQRDVGPPFGRPSEFCLTCGACLSVCPTGAIDLKLFSTRRPRPARSDYDKRLAGRRAIYLPFLQSVPRAPVIDPAMCMRLNRERCGLCEAACEARAIDYTQRGTEERIEVGAVILAPGFCETDAARATALGYGRLANVVTSIEFERILSAGGPFAGHVVRPSDGRPPRRIAFVQCVGSRNATGRGREYCSSVCCTYAVKQATVAREHDAEISAAIFNMDMRTFGKDFDKYYERARDSGIRFVRSAVSAIEEIPETGSLLVHYVAENDTPQTDEFDLVVLSVGLQPTKDAAALAEAAGIALDEYGFAATDRTNPLATSRAGVFACGVFSGPKDIPESVMEASGAAGCAAVLLADVRGRCVVQKVEPPELDVRGVEPRIGVFVCHCGINIAGTVDVEAVREYASTLPYVVYCEETVSTRARRTRRSAFGA
ncbi:MAG: FAD-dependent oxidoreductase [Candidatus Sumerlaeia bacterium]|nr:FAD-dependent oxidoreductase [Candidatus Sumerlaeia bacterium]